MYGHVAGGADLFRGICDRLEGIVAKQASATYTPDSLHRVRDAH
jgi:hypothetical protein